MNLKARNKNGDIRLWQTPTRISYTILPPSFGEVKGKKAVEALERYCQWVQYSTNGAWESVEELEEAEDEIDEHLKYIKEEMKVSKLEVWVM
jgi:hypothetical protein